MTIRIEKLIKDDWLYQKFPGQINAQDVYVELDLVNKVLTASFNPEVGNAVPFSVYHGKVIRYPIKYPVWAVSANGLLEELLPLANDVLNGFSEEWNGNNWVGMLNESALRASEGIQWEIDTYFYDEDFISGWEAKEWLWDESNKDLGISSGMDEKEIEQVYTNIQKVAKDAGVYLDNLYEEIERRIEEEEG